MKNTKLIIVVVVVLALVALALARSVKPGEVGVDGGSSTSTGSISTQNTKPTTKSSNAGTIKSTLIKTAATESGLPEIEFLDKTLSFPMPGYDGVNIRVQKIAFGRGDAVNSTGCQGIPNTNFSTYLYPGNGICIPAKTVDGVPRGILAIHLLIENNGRYNFGGNTSTLKLHYLRIGSTIKPVHKFADALSSLENYNITPYSSKEVVLSYLVPEDQKQFDLLFDYKGVILPDPAHNVYTDSNGGLFIDFSKKTFELISR
jgi:hypothetical protein